MAWENALDRLVLQQIHLGERGERRPAEIRELIDDLRGLGPERTETWFHIGYAQALLGLDLPSPTAGPKTARLPLPLQYVEAELNNRRCSNRAS